MFTPEFCVGLGIVAVFFGILGVCGILADHVLPKIPALQRWMEHIDPFPGDSEYPKACLSVKALFDHFGASLSHTNIVVTKGDDKAYYDLYDKEGELVSCDGEEWPVEKREGGLVTLIADEHDDSENALRFFLTEEEFGVATFR